MIRNRNVLLGGPASAALVAVMIAGCFVLWIVVPIVWLWVGSQLEASGSPLGTALMVAMVGAICSIVVIAWGLAIVNRKHVELREARALPIGADSALEVILVVSAALAAVGFAVWFFGFSGSSPVPLNISY